MVLLEIGFWKAFEQPPQYLPTLTASENRWNITKKFLNGSLAHHMGNAFQNVVRTCLSDDLTTSDDAIFQQKVSDLVVEPLRRLTSGLLGG